jgi:hypothetical protein
MLKYNKMETKIKSFEEYLSDNKCDTHTNNDPAGFEKWLEQLDIDELIKYADEYGEWIQMVLAQNYDKMKYND